MSEEQETQQGIDAGESGAEQTEETFNLVFFPQLEGGADYEGVRDKLAETLKVDKRKVDGWYDAEAPTVLLKGVAKDVAERYMEAILQCGAACNIQSSRESGGLSLVPKSRNVDFFICPSCEYEEEVPRGTKHEQCPKCGLVIAKWEEKMREERERERIRRRLMRDQRLKSEDQEELDRKREELARLRELELEIMKELGIKPPGRFWLFFEKHPFSVAGALGIVVVAVAGVLFQQIDRYLEAEELAELRAAPAPEEAQRIAPVISAAVQLQQNGNQAVVSELADVTTTMHGSAAASQQEIVQAAQQMMKGVDPQTFLATASKKALPGSQTLPGPEQQVPVPVNRNTVGGITGIKGIDQFEPEVLRKVSPPILEHGYDKVLQVLTEQRLAPDPQDPERTIVIDEIDEMDGSMIVDLMKELSRDQEWDQYLAANVEVHLAGGEVELASELIDRIGNPLVKVQALGSLMVAMAEADPAVNLKPTMERIEDAATLISDPDVRASAVLSLGKQLAAAGHESEPAASTARVQAMIRESKNPYEQSYLSSRLAIVALEEGDTARASQLLKTAVNQAGRITAPADRVSAFARIAQRYYDARNTTLANEIVAEAQLIAATRLDPADRSRIFGEIAMAQGYMGDMKGARDSIENAAEGVGRQQLMAKLAEFLIGLGRYYDAQGIMEDLTDPIEYNRLLVKLVTALHYEGRSAQVRERLQSAKADVMKIDQPGERALILGQFGRIARRAGLVEQADAFFEQAGAVVELLEGRRRAVSQGLLGLDQTRALMPYSSQETMRTVKEAIVKDPITTEILATERVIDNLMPAGVREHLEPEPDWAR